MWTPVFIEHIISPGKKGEKKTVCNKNYGNSETNGGTIDIENEGKHNLK